MECLRICINQSLSAIKYIQYNIPINFCEDGFLLLLLSLMTAIFAVLLKIILTEDFLTFYFIPLRKARGKHKLTQIANFYDVIA
jgi:hypothetical protein